MGKIIVAIDSFKGCLTSAEANYHSSFDERHKQIARVVNSLLFTAWVDFLCVFSSGVVALSRHSSVYPTNDFIGDILQQQTRLEIMSPAWLREKMKEITERMAASYK